MINMPRSLAKGKRKVALLTDVADFSMKTVTLEELQDGIQASCVLLADGGFGLKVDASETETESSLCDTIDVEIFTSSKASGELIAFRYFDQDGQSETGTATDADGEIGDAVHQMLRVRGTEFYVVSRLTSKLATDPWAVDDDITVWKCVTDNWQEGELTGFIKSTYPLSVLKFESNAKVVA